MTKFSLGQEWVSAVTKSEAPDVSVIGAILCSSPSAAEFNSLIDVIARSETAREISRRKWIAPRSAPGRERVTERGLALFEFLTANRPCGPAYARFKGRRSGRQRDLIDELATMAWVSHVSDEAQKQARNVAFDASLINGDFVSYLTKLSVLGDGPKQALRAVSEIGICVVVEGGLPGMSVDGASFHSKQVGPVLAMTLRHDRLDNFWFTLLHEIGHIVLHLNRPSDDIFIDSEEEESDELETEAEANAFAKDSFIPRDIWFRSDARRHGTESGVIKLARQLGIHPAIVAGRIRFERREFRILNNLIGFGEVRRSVFSD